MPKKFAKLFDNNFFEKNVPVVPRLGAKYKFLIDDLISLFNFYILQKRKIVFNKIPSLFAPFPSTFCNAKCGYCASRCIKSKRGILPFNLFKKGVDEYIGLGGKYVSLTPTIGDVLIDPGLFQKIKYLQSKGIACSLYTNAMLLHKHIEDFLSTPIDSLHIDLGDVLPEIDAKIFRITIDQSKQRLNSVLELLKKMDKRGIKFELILDFRGERAPKQIMNDLEKSEFWEYHKKGLFKMGFLQVYDNWGGLISKKDLLGVQTLKIPPKFKRYPCKGLFQLSLLPDGEIRLCGCRCRDTLKDELVIGDIKKNSLKSLFGSKKHKEVIERFYKKDLPRVCIDCGFYRPKIGK